MGQTRTLFLFTIPLAVVAACAADDSVSGPGDGQPKTTETVAQPGTDTAKVGTGQTSNGPVATVSVAPRTMAIPLNYYGHANVYPRDAQRVLVVGKKVSWRSSNVSIATVSDTGLIAPKALGSAFIVATVEGKSDSLAVTVVEPGQTVTIPPAVEKFSLTVLALAGTPGGDTSKYSPLPGAAITVTRTMTLKGDTLNPAVVVGSATAGADGKVRFTNIENGAFTVRAVPPAGSAYGPGVIGFGPVRGTTDVTVHAIVRAIP